MGAAVIGVGIVLALTLLPRVARAEARARRIAAARSPRSVAPWSWIDRPRIKVGTGRPRIWFLFRSFRP